MTKITQYEIKNQKTTNKIITIEDKEHKYYFMKPFESTEVKEEILEISYLDCTAWKPYVSVKTINGGYTILIDKVIKERI